MRIPLTKLYRAFPELDQFDDERCGRFVRAAQGTLIRRVFHFGLACFAAVAGLTLTGLVVGFVAEATFGFGTNARRFSIGTMSESTSAAIIMLCAFLGAAMAGLCVRDYLLRRNVRRVLRDSGSCWECRYRLLGLPVSAYFTITCPECGTITKVDRSLGELSDGDAALAPAVTTATTQFIVEKRPRKPRKPRKWLWRSCGVGVLLLLLSAGGWEWRVREQASRARASKPGTAGFTSFMMQSLPPQSSETDAWPSLMRAVATYAQVERAYLNELGGQWPTYELSEEAKQRLEAGDAGDARAAGWVYGGPLLYPDFGSMTQPRQGETPEVTRFNAEAGRVAKELLRRASDAGLLEQLRELSTKLVTVPSIDLDANAPVFSFPDRESGVARSLAALQSGRIDLLIQEQRIDEALDVVGELLGLARVVGDQPTFSDRQTALTIQSLAIVAASRIIDSGLTPAQLDGLDRMIRERGIRTPLARAIQGEKILYLNNICWWFSDPDRARFGMLSPATIKAYERCGGGAFGNVLKNFTKMKLGTLDENIRFTDEYFAHLEAQSVLPVPQRSALPLALAEKQSQLLVATVVEPAITWVQNGQDVQSLLLDCLRLRIEIERFRFTHARLPTANEFVPLRNATVPVEMLSGQVFLYRPIDPATDRHRRSYLLYLPGPDGTDNGGVELSLPKRYWIGVSRWRDMPSGVDYIVNDPSR